MLLEAQTDVLQRLWFLFPGISIYEGMRHKYSNNSGTRVSASDIGPEQTSTPTLRLLDTACARLAHMHDRVYIEPKTTSRQLSIGGHVMGRIV